MKVHTQPRLGHLLYIARNLKTTDRNEMLKAKDTRSPFKAIQESVNVSAHVDVLCDGYVPFAVIGLCPDGCVWLLSTENLQENAKSFSKYIKRKLEDLKRREYTFFYNYVDPENKVTMNWLKRLGFTQGDADSNGLVLMTKENR